MNCTIAAIILTETPKVISVCTLYPILLKVALVDATPLGTEINGIIVENTSLPLQPFICNGGTCILNSTTLTIPYSYYISFNTTLVISIDNFWRKGSNSFTFTFTEATVTLCSKDCYTYTVLANYYLTFSFNKTCTVFTKPYSISVNCRSLTISRTLFYETPLYTTYLERGRSTRFMDLPSLLSIATTLLLVFRMYQFEE